MCKKRIDRFYNVKRLEQDIKSRCNQRWKLAETARNAVLVKELLPVRRSGSNFW